MHVTAKFVVVSYTNWQLFASSGVSWRFHGLKHLEVACTWDKYVLDTSKNLKQKHRGQIVLSVESCMVLALCTCSNSLLSWPNGIVLMSILHPSVRNTDIRMASLCLSWRGTLDKEMAINGKHTISICFVPFPTPVNHRDHVDTCRSFTIRDTKILFEPLLWPSKKDMMSLKYWSDSPVLFTWMYTCTYFPSFNCNSQHFSQ